MTVYVLELGSQYDFTFYGAYSSLKLAKKAAKDHNRERDYRIYASEIDGDIKSSGLYRPYLGESILYRDNKKMKM
jgi:hypothetical protein